MFRSPFKSKDLKYFYAFLSIIAISLIILVITRVQRGLSAIVLSILAILLFLYWANEIRKTVKKQPGLGIIRTAKKFTYESIKSTTKITGHSSSNMPDDRTSSYYGGFGTAIVSLGDQDGDGVNDIAVGGGGIHCITQQEPKL